MRVYLKIAHEVMPIRVIFMVGCGCDPKIGPAMLVYLKIAYEVMPIRAIFIVGCGCDLKTRSLRFAPLPGPAKLVT